MKFPCWKKFRGTETTVLVLSYHSAMQYVNGDLDRETERWVHFDDERWEDIDEPILTEEAREKVRQLFLKNKVVDIQSDRKNDYGDADESFSSIADFWSNYLSRLTKQYIVIDKTDVAMMMVLFKVSRNAYKRKKDNVVDCASYADFALQFEENEDDLNF